MRGPAPQQCIAAVCSMEALLGSDPLGPPAPVEPPLQRLCLQRHRLAMKRSAMIGKARSKKWWPVPSSTIRQGMRCYVCYGMGFVSVGVG